MVSISKRTFQWLRRCVIRLFDWLLLCCSNVDAHKRSRAFVAKLQPERTLLGVDMCMYTGHNGYFMYGFRTENGPAGFEVSKLNTLHIDASVGCVCVQCTRATRFSGVH